MRLRCYVERATPEDLDALLALERACSPHPWGESTFVAALAGTAGQSVFVARTPFDRPCLAAFCACAYVSDEAHVHNLATQPDRRRQGLARLLLTVAASVGRRKGATVAHLEVRAGNAPARALYVRMGYREVGTRRDYYASPREDAVLLSLALQAGPSPAAVAPPQHRC